MNLAILSTVRDYGIVTNGTVRNLEELGCSYRVFCVTTRKGRMCRKWFGSLINLYYYEEGRAIYIRKELAPIRK